MTERKKVERKGAGSAETSYYAAGLLRILRGEDVELVARAVEATAADVATGLTIRHDNGSQYISHDFQNEIAWLGAKSSPSFVRAPEGNGCAERFIRTLKENLLWVRTFDTIEELQAALQKFKDDYNDQWLIQRHGHRSPNHFRRDAMDRIPAAA
jgi:transposase InsO family protein